MRIIRHIFYEEGEMIMLSIKHLTKIYSGNKKAVDDISLDIQYREFIAFIGTSGSGKTTALRMINRMIEATEGQIEIDGKDVRSMNPVELRRNIGYVIQQIGLMPHMTIKENIVLVPKLLKWTKEEKDKRAKELIKLVGFTGVIFRALSSRTIRWATTTYRCRKSTCGRTRYYFNG